MGLDRRFDHSNAPRYHSSVIKSFREAETEEIWQERVSLRLPRTIQSRALMKLQQLNAAGDLRDLRIPVGNQLEKLAGDRSGQWSIRINEQWRICFEWTAGHAKNVEICDYH
jgi:proteic killer suppression protein